MPALLWMGVIFLGSCDSHSAQHSSRLLGPLLRWLFPNLAGENIDQVVFICRKIAHLTEYAVLALLVWWAVRRPVRNDPRPWSWAQARLIALICVFYAATDEFHQVFVPTREARIHDVVLDTCGALVMLSFIWRVGRWRKYW